MKTRAFAGAAAGLLVAVGMAGSASAAPGGVQPYATWPSDCSSSFFCAYKNSGYSTQLLASKAVSGTNKVQPAERDAISSAANRSTNNWVGVSVRTLQPDDNVFTFLPATGYQTAGSAWNDKIDHFNVR